MTGWNEVMLKDVVSILGDGLHGTPEYDDNGEYYFINGNNLSNGKIVIKESTRRANKEEFKKYKKNLNDRTILVSINGTVGNIAAYNNEKCFLGKSACYFNILENVEKKFILYVATNNHFQTYISEFAHGTTIKNVSLNTIREYPFLLPEQPEQKAIADVLSSLDDKIDLLHRQNKTLAAMAETLFRQWFAVEAQEDWVEYSISDFADHNKNNVVPANLKNEMFHHYSLPAFDDGKRPTVELGSEILSNKYKVAAYSILVSKLNPRVPRIWPIGDLKSENAICSTEFQVFKPKNEKLYGYLYFLLRSNDAVDALTMAASGTSGSHQRVRPEDILNIRTRLPSIERAEQYSNLVIPGIDKTRSNLVQIQTLEKLRDNLLPKLMSGEVRVACEGGAS